MSNDTSGSFFNPQSTIRNPQSAILILRIIRNIISFLVAPPRHDDVIVFIGAAVCEFIVVFSFTVEFVAHFHVGEVFAQYAFFVEVFIFFYEAFGFEDGHANEVISIVRFEGQCGYFFSFLVIIRYKVVGVPGGVLHFNEANDVFREGIVIFDNAFFSQGLGVIWF